MVKENKNMTREKIMFLIIALSAAVRLQDRRYDRQPDVGRFRPGWIGSNLGGSGSDSEFRLYGELHDYGRHRKV